MAKSISVNDLIREAEEAQQAYSDAVEQRKNIRKVVRTLLEAELLDEESATKIEEIFPKRGSAAESDDDNDNQ